MSVRGTAFAVLVLSLLLGSVGGVGAGDSPQQGLGQTGLFAGLGFDRDGGPVSIKADQLEVDYLSDQLTYRGHVVVRQNDVVMKSERLNLVYRADDPDPIVRAEASGRVSIQKGLTMAMGGRAVYDRATRTIVLSEDPMLQQGPNKIDGEKIKVYLAEGRSVVEGGKGRVRAVLYPSSETVGTQ